MNETSKDVLRLRYAFGEGIENYFNDSPIDVGAKTNPGNAVTPIIGDALPAKGLRGAGDFDAAGRRYFRPKWPMVFGSACDRNAYLDARTLSSSRDDGDFAAEIVHAFPHTHKPQTRWVCVCQRKPSAHVGDLQSQLAAVP